MVWRIKESPGWTLGLTDVQEKRIGNGNGNEKNGECQRYMLVFKGAASHNGARNPELELPHTELAQEDIPCRTFAPRYVFS